VIVDKSKLSLSSDHYIASLTGEDQPMFARLSLLGALVTVFATFTSAANAGGFDPVEDIGMGVDDLLELLLGLLGGLGL
jgi:hypothetical protein